MQYLRSCRAWLLFHQERGALRFVGWRAIFYINVPIGLIAFGLSVIFIETDHPEAKNSEPFDWRGAVVFSAGLVILLLGLDQGQTWGWLSLATVGCILVSFVLLGLFLRV